MPDKLKYVRPLMIEYGLTGFISHDKLEENILVIASKIANDAMQDPLLLKELRDFVSYKTLD